MKSSLLRIAVLAVLLSPPLLIAPSLHAHAACAVPRAINVEYFFDHFRIEQMFFDGALAPVNGMLSPDASRHGFGLECKWRDLEKYRTYGNVGA